MFEQNFLYPHSKTLKNKYGIMDKTALKEQCAHDVSQEMINLRQEPLPEKINSSYLKYIHQRLFQHTFEWAGHTRDKPFTFADGSTACMPEMQKEDAEVPFAIGSQIQKGLEDLDQTLSAKNYLKGLSREEFVEQAAELFVSLNNTHPFREGNGRTQRMFFEKLGQAAGHKLDFSLVTKGRMVVASVAAAQNGYLRPMRHLFEDISNPEKCRILKDFLDHMKNIGGNDIQYQYVVAADEGIIYEGKYIACGAESFLMDVNGRFIIGNKDHLTAEQLKTLKPGNKFTFIVPETKDLDTPRVTEQILEPIRQQESLERLKNGASLQASKTEVEHISKLTDDNPHISPDTMEIMNQNPQEREQRTEQISQSSHSLAQTQQKLRETTLQTNDAIKNDITTAPMAEKKRSHDQQREQQRSPKAMEYATITAEKLDVGPPSFPHEKLPLSPKVQEKDISSRNFFYPNSVTLKNKYGIKNYGKLQVQCAHDSARAIINLRQEPLPEKIDSFYLKYIHHSLFKNTFEWAGHTREKPFTFADGTTACMQQMKKAGTVFASGEKVQERLTNLDRALSEKNYLKGLSREEFVKNAAEMMTQLNYTHPFRDGNGRTQRMFFEKLSQSAGHKLDFSLMTKERINLASIASLQDSNLEPMKDLFEDISHPEKVLVLKEFMDHMKMLGLESINHRLIKTPKEGETYTGFYRGGGANGFMIDVKGTFIIGNKKYLAPEQLKSLKIGDKLSFTAPFTHEMQEILIPKENIPSLTNEELAEMVQNSPLVQTSRKKIELLCKIIYGKSNALQNKLPEIKIPVTCENISEGEKFARQVGAFPQSVHRLRGINICGIKNGTRLHAQENILPLSHAIFDYMHTVKLAEKDILHDHHMEQKRCEKSIRTPSEWMKNLCSLPKEQREEILLQSPELRAEIKAYMCQLHDRLSASKRRAIQENNHQALANTLGTSLNNAKEIAEIFKQGEELQQNMQSLSRRLDAFSIRDVHQSIKENNDENRTETLGTAAMKANKITETIKQEKAIQEHVQPHKVERAKIMAMVF
ncbi:BID domain-containing T4SS effector [Bartonella jaculi]|uniref:protein adenylyltransferase n=1 Tax=Bartonella jaculi TaxID=686226 RepID=A0ABP9N5T6_9HYPH